MTGDPIWFRLPPPAAVVPEAPPRVEPPTVTVTIDERRVEVPAGRTILDACRTAGIDVPTLCYLETLTPVNACRVCVVEVDPRWREGLKDVETCSHLVLLYWMDRSPRNLVLQVPGHYGVQHGTFALRSPARPNPVAMSVAKLLRVDGNRLSVTGLDCLDGTPLLDIKPYFASTDSVPEAVVGWHRQKD